MAVKKQSNWNFVARLAGLSGLLLAIAGLVLWGISVVVATEETDGYIFASGLGLFMLVVGGVIAIATIVIELPALTGVFASRRGAFGSNVALQILLAVLLLIGVNAFSFFHYERFDWTREQIFSEIRDQFGDQLSRLRSDTSIVVFLRHTSFGQAASMQDNYDAAAERQIVEKVKDIVDQFREFGPRFHVEVLDIQDDGFERKLKAIRRRTPLLADAIQTAPENSVFFYSHSGGDVESDRVQRLSFHDIFQLDRVASKDANGKRGNLVLTYQGVAPFARKVLNIEEKKPHIAVGVVHEYLGVKGPEMYGMPGAEKTLTSRGFTVQDVVLKTKWGEGPMPEPSVLTHDQHRFEVLEEQITINKENVKELSDEVNELKKEKEEWQKTPLAELKKKYVLGVDAFRRPIVLGRTEAVELKKAGRLIGFQDIDDDVREQYLLIIERQLTLRDLALQQETTERDDALRQQQKLNVADLAEQKRISDLRAKFSRLLANSDLLILPRLTLMNVSRPDENLPNELHLLDQAQADAIKDYMKSGKPVLFCLGPTNDPGRFNPLQGSRNHIEEMLEDLGVKLPRQTVLFNAETKMFAQRRAGLLIRGTPVEPPPVQFDLPPSLGKEGELPPHPIRASMKVTARSVSSVDRSEPTEKPADKEDVEVAKDDPLLLRLRHPRPVSYVAPDGTKPKNDAVFMLSDEASWNESQPFPTDGRPPKFDPKGDEDRGVTERETRGPFPLAVAIEAKLPRSWYASDEEPKSTRLAVIGHGGVFMDKTLAPVKEKLLLDTVNWLLGRDDLLSREGDVWEFPRVQISPTQEALWRWGTVILMPLIFVFMGCVMLMVRHTR